MNGRKECLQKAERATNEERASYYGEPENNFDTIAKFWSAYLGKRCMSGISAADVAAMMILLKIGRECTSNFPHSDNAVDACGYAACWYEMLNTIHVNNEG